MALVVKSTPGELVTKLAQNGIVVGDQSLSIKQIALNNKKSPRALLGVIVKDVKSAGPEKGDQD